MSEATTLFHHQRTPQRRRRMYIAFAVGALLTLALGPSTLFALGFSLKPAAPDTLQLLSVTSAAGAPGSFRITVRTRRADGGRIAAYSTTADLVHPQTERQVLGQQCGFTVRPAEGGRAEDVILSGVLPAGSPKPVSALVKVDVSVIPPSDQVRWAAWELSSRKLPQPPEPAIPPRSLTCLVQLPPADASPVK